MSVWLNPDGSDAEPNAPGAVRVFVKFETDGSLSMMLRAASFDDMITAGQGLPVPMFDQDGRQVPGVSFFPFPSPLMTPPTFDSEGNMTDPGTSDPRAHANATMTPELVARGAWRAPALAWSAGEPGQANAGEETRVLAGVELIDPESLSSPSAGLHI
ncbi:hypothetical protein [Mesobacterium pallidum]|uniref:hypothetical protein n=1 Tax=Mesobacterium pallidum TaxID=2872037 RepID=UPI001EE1E061|nr:hypothetical protein [Mesobacterium pallidum]